MIKLKALNETASSEDEIDSSQDNQQLYNTETQEENLQAIYTNYLISMSKNQIEDAKNYLFKLFSLIKDLDEDQASPVQKNLKYLTYKNLGDFFNDKIDYYFEALKIDNSDINLWIKTAKRAFNFLEDYILARNCLEVAFRLNSKNWIINDLLLDCYYILGDYENCSIICEHCLKIDPGYLKSYVVLNEIKKFTKNLNIEINNKFLNQENESVEKILNRLKSIKNKRIEKSLEGEKNEITNEKENYFELKINKKNYSLNDLGVNLIESYSELKKKNISLLTNIKIIEYNKVITSSSSSSNEESNSYESKLKSINNQNSSSKEDSQGNSQYRTFPFELVDKRRSSRVQSIQNKTKDLDDTVLLERITCLFEEISKDNEEKKQQTKSIKKESKLDLELCKDFYQKLIEKFKEKSSLKILDLFKIYLYFIANELKDLPVPKIFKDIYIIHRHHFPLPDFFNILNDDNLDKDEILAILVANEIKYNNVEVYFLNDLMIKLENYLDEEKFNEFFIRLLIIRGVNESNIKFLDFAKQKLENFNFKNSIKNVNNEKITFQFIKNLISSLSVNNLQKLLEEENYDQLFEMLNPDLKLNDNEIKIICQCIQKSQNYEKGIDFFTNRENISSIAFDTLIICLQKVKNYKINHKLVDKIIHIAKTQFTIQSWSILFTILLAVPNSIVKQNQILNFIELSHQYLGNKSRCNAHNGEYLLLVLDYLINKCTVNFDELIWKCFYCLYGYNKKGYTFQQHCNTHVKLSWDNCSLIYNYTLPEDLPEFDTAYKSNTINSETRDLFVQIIDLMPSNIHPKNFLSNLEDYLINGKPLPTQRNFTSHQITQDLFYFVADFYFKNKEFEKGISYYKLDICANHHRFDSWAAVALSLTSLIDELVLNDSPSYYDADLIYENSVQAIRCYSNALRLDKNNTKIWIEFGNFVYNIGSYCSKMKKTKLYFDLIDQEKPKTSIEELDKRIEEMFQHAEYCFKSSLKTDCEEEMWLHYYILGKVAEKKSSLKAMYFYDLADKCLFLTGANYPDKINYNNQQILAMEAVEIHYRLHSCALKALLSGKKWKIKSLSKIKFYLLSALRSPFVKKNQKNKVSEQNQFFTKNLNNKEFTEDIFNFISDLLDVTVEKIDKKENDLKMTIINLCIFGLKRCIIRFSHHYKSYYRLAHYYFAIGNFKAAKSVLLDTFEDIDILSGSITTIPGLFNDRKINNFFNGIWRIPVDDIERPGSFSNHMYKCMLLFIQVCTGLRDYNFLISVVVINLSRTPDINKKYLRDCERKSLAKKAFENACIIMLQQLAIQPNAESKREKLIEINRLLEKLTRMNLFVQKVAELMNQCTKHVNVLFNL